KLAERYSAVKGPIGSNSFHATERLRLSPHRFLDRRVQPRVRTQNRSEQTPINDLGGAFHMMPSSRLHDPGSAPIEKRADSAVLSEKRIVSPRNVPDSESPLPKIHKKKLSRDTKQVFGR